MSAIQDAIEALKATVIQGESDKHVRDALDRVTSFLILLNSSSPSLQAIRKLRSVLRQPLQPLYAASLEATLQLSSAVLSQILGERLPDARRVGDTASCAEWDATANVILAGVLDFVDHNSDGAYIFVSFCS
ncbi:hypothetical protein F5I97DRAFT_1847067 [Phlebopus sp. FC_14]|nr:hypothetical protein F5I97DRAFT_1847067 [Phlebopus sp. FC_14]